jgi:hypothetical protein
MFCIDTTNDVEDDMAWGIIMAMFSVVGMFVLIFGQTPTGQYQTFGREVVNPPDTSTADAEQIEVRRAA